MDEKLARPQQSADGRIGQIDCEGGFCHARFPPSLSHNAKRTQRIDSNAVTAKRSGIIVTSTNLLSGRLENLEKARLISSLRQSWKRGESPYTVPMKNGLLEATDGWDIVVNGVDRTFRDREPVAIAAACYLKQQWPRDEVQIRTRADGTLRTVRPDFRLE
ncbi:MAG TPA: hypothetical protein VNQ99_04555 [Xanthobacteraceae bacterium]|nr:hypothetical protein [Xanthobacteraceae bacterium]